MNSTLWWWGKKTMLLESSQEGPLCFPQESQELAQSLRTMERFLAEPALGRGGCWKHPYPFSQKYDCDSRSQAVSLYCISQIAIENYELRSQVYLYYFMSYWVFVVLWLQTGHWFIKRMTWGLFSLQKTGEGIIKFWLGPKKGEWGSEKETFFLLK